MSFFAKKKSTPIPETTISSEILSQVRVMGEKSASSAPSQSSPQPAAALSTNNPVSNPFIQKSEEVAPEVQIPSRGVDTAPIQQQVAPDNNIQMTIDRITLDDGKGIAKEKHSSKIIIIGSILAVALVLIIGIFLYLEKVRDAEIAALPTPELPGADDTNIPENNDSALTTEEFSLDRANYLILDPETATVESINTEIASLGMRIKEAGITEPVVFQITDQNNIPMALNRFAFLMELELPDTLLSSLDEDFTVVVYNEPNGMRLGVASKFKEEILEPQKILEPIEQVLPSGYKSLLYPPDVILPPNPVFSTGSYSSALVRYSNLLPEKFFSFDYILQDKLFYIGNSKDVTRKTFEVGNR